ncbi:MAG: S-methyl-5-thioribose-1-phosphate isomerase, partial [Gammaproteobacteria bacterium]|nr:S-methyl-5-thioribose-1-phosphate isomerase [Gammaproteobacteria bacterium]
MNNIDERDSIRAVKWQDNSLVLLDQRQLPHNECLLRISRCDDVARAISDMVVRGAPAIGIAAAYGYVLALNEIYPHHPQDWRAAIQPK